MFLICKLNNKGEYLNVNTINKISDGQLHVISIDKTGSAYITGLLSSEFTINNKTYNTNNLNSIIIGKICYTDMYVKTLGILQSNVENNKMCEVRFDGTISNTYTNLIPGMNYGIDSSNKLVLINDNNYVNIRFIGTAIESNKLLLNIDKSIIYLNNNTDLIPITSALHYMYSSIDNHSHLIENLLKTVKQNNIDIQVLKKYPNA